jgi:oligoendopeptidase F
MISKNSERYQWNLTPLFKNDDDPKIIVERKKAEKESYKFINKWKNRHDYLSHPKILKQALNEYENWFRHYGANAYEEYYFDLRNQQNKNNPKLKAKFNQSQEISLKIANDIQFFELNIAKTPLKLQSKFLNDRGLKVYKHFLERLFISAKYLLSDKEEKILNLKSIPAYSNWQKMTSGFLSKEKRKVLISKNKKAEKGFSEILKLMSNSRKIIRDSAAKAFNDILRKHVDVAEAEINSILANKKIDDELRGFSRPDEGRHISDDIETKIVDEVVDVVEKNYSISQKYYNFKAKLLKLKKLEYHERNIPYGKLDKKYRFAQAINIIDNTFSRLDKGFGQIFNSFIKNKQFDIYPAQNKSGGAFCAHGLISQPTYILLNYSDQLKDVLTIAHETGHGINNELIKQRQNALNFGTPISTAEVASTFMEDFVLQEIIKGANEELRLAIMVDQLDNFVSTIFRQIACYQFEKDLHREFRAKGYLSKEEIGKIFSKDMLAYMGKSVVASTGSENWWIYWSHIRTFFYVYSYASGLLISKSLQNMVKQNPVLIEKVKEFLASGLSDSPKRLFLNLGIDISKKSFWEKGINEINILLNETMKLAKKLKKI